MVLLKDCHLAKAFIITCILILEVRFSSSAARRKRESDGSLFAYCPPSRVINATTIPTRVWWDEPAVHHRPLQSVRRLGSTSGSLFHEGRHSVIYQAEGFDGTIDTCEIILTINAIRRCQRVTPIPPTVMVCTNENMAHSTCTFSCPSGHRLLGSSSVTCRTSGEWFGTFPICRRSAAPVQSAQRCQNVIPVPPTNMICSNNNMAHSTCTFYCPIGYQLSGPSSVTCQASGEWSQPFSLCRAVQSCRDMVPILPTEMSCSNFNKVQSTCTFSCPTEYQLSGTSSVTCQSNGEWSDSFPICIRTQRQCPNVAPILPTIMVCSNFNMVHSTCSFYCPSRFHLFGSSSVTCRRSGAWSGTFPICRQSFIQQCLNVAPLLPTVMNCSNANMVGSTCTFSCPSGFQLRGSTSVTCTASGDWSGDLPICRRLAIQQCVDTVPTLPTIMRCSNVNMVDSTCTFSCPSGYELIGSSSVTCTATGKWSEDFPSCRRSPVDSLFTQCPPSRIINATALLTRVWWNIPGVNDRLVYSLQRMGPPPGSLFTEGKHSIIYEAKGFDGSNSTCEIVFTVTVQQCQDMIPLTPTFMRCSNNNAVNSECTFSCPRGYQLTGASSVTCQSSGVWSETFPKCALVVCDPLSAPEHGVMSCSIPNNHQGSWCEFGCLAGYRMVGNRVRTCLSGEWSGLQPTCEDFRPPSFAFCPKLIRVATEDGRASAKVDYMTPIPIDSSSTEVELVSGQPSGERFAVGFHSIHYRAKDASDNMADCIFYIEVYDNEAPRFDFCPNSERAFTESQSSAVPVTYRVPTATDNASPTSLNVSRVFGKASGSLFLPGVHGIHYRATDKAGNKAYCNFYVVVKVTQCDRLNEQEHMHISCSEYLYQLGSWCSFSCDTGFVLSGSAIRRCESFGWSGQEATCIGSERTLSLERSPTPVPPTQLVTSLGQIVTEVDASISLEYEYEYNEYEYEYEEYENVEQAVTDQIINS